MKSGILFLEGACGISGDMTVAALLGLGGNAKKLDAALKSLPVSGWTCTITNEKSYGIAGISFNVLIDGLEPEHHHEHHHEHEHEHAHHHPHIHRNLAAVNAIIDAGDLSDRARDLAKKIFRIVAEAEAEAHGCPMEEVHFHEVGAVDSIVDIVAAAVLIDDLNITDCVVNGLSEGSGFVHCAHGDLPVPVPAVLNIARAFAIPLRNTDAKGEMVTPTGIAIAAALRTRTSLPENYTCLKIGIGLGKRDFGRPNILRAMLLAEPDKTTENEEQITVVETNIDDATGEELGVAMEALFAAGARDASFSPCFMKKNRPAWLLRVITDDSHISAVEDTIFRTTTAIGLRKYPVQRTTMARSIKTVRLPQGPEVQVKVCTYGEICRFYPEYETVKAAAEQLGLSCREVYLQAQELAK